MSNYSDNPNSIRVDLFKPTGKWVTTVAVIWSDPTNWDLHSQLRKDMQEQHSNYVGQNYRAVCLEPPESDFVHPFQISSL